MSFDWLEPDLNYDSKRESTKADEMYEQELVECAALLVRLGFNKKDVKIRLKNNIRWDFELHASPAHLRKLDKIINDVFSRKRLGVKGPPSL